MRTYFGIVVPQLRPPVDPHAASSVAVRFPSPFASAPHLAFSATISKLIDTVSTTTAMNLT
jgi:hypothetical protein